MKETNFNPQDAPYGYIAVKAEDFPCSKCALAGNIIRCSRVRCTEDNREDKTAVYFVKEKE